MDMEEMETRDYTEHHAKEGGTTTQVLVVLVVLLFLFHLCKTWLALYSGGVIRTFPAIFYPS